MSRDIYEDYVGWANTLDSAGEDSTEARERILQPEMLELLGTVVHLVDEAEAKADLLKKWIFYGKAPETGSFGRRLHVNLDILEHAKSQLTHENIRYIHAMLGLQTEIGELIKGFFGYLFFGDPLDIPNMAEEIGDLFWYMALLAKGMGFGEFAPYLLANKAKLVARYGDTWTQDAALNRDTEKELTQVVQNLKHEVDTEYPTLTSIVEQLMLCGFKDEQGHNLMNNTAFLALLRCAKEQENGS